eukprot:1860093-Rhodomonas_salina.2
MMRLCVPNLSQKIQCVCSGSESRVCGSQRTVMHAQAAATFQGQGAAFAVAPAPAPARAPGRVDPPPLQRVLLALQTQDRRCCWRVPSPRPRRPHQLQHLARLPHLPSHTTVSRREFSFRSLRNRTLILRHS